MLRVRHQADREGAGERGDRDVQQVDPGQVGEGHGELDPASGDVEVGRRTGHVGDNEVVGVVGAQVALRQVGQLPRQVGERLLQRQGLGQVLLSLLVVGAPVHLEQPLDRVGLDQRQLDVHRRPPARALGEAAVLHVGDDRHLRDDVAALELLLVHPVTDRAAHRAEADVVHGDLRAEGALQRLHPLERPADESDRALFADLALERVIGRPEEPLTPKGPRRSAEGLAGASE